MKKINIAILMFCFGIIQAQETTKSLVNKEVLRILDSINKSKTSQEDLVNVMNNDSLKENNDSLKVIVENHSMKFEGMDEQISGMQSSLDRLSKIKISGYIQAQYETYDTWNAGVHGVIPSAGSLPITNSFSLRRARIKFTYEAVDGVTLVLCPNFEVDRVRLTDVYAQLNDRWLHTFSIWAGLFNRPTYEVEYSSASREFAERSLVTRTLYPQERDMGAKVEANFLTKFEIPLKLQFALLNGNFGIGPAVNQVKDIDNYKDVMVRAVYSFKFPSKGIAIDLGGNGYFGHNAITKQTTVPAVFSDVNGDLFTPKVGDDLNKTWYGAEMQVYYDFLGGLSLKTEYISGSMTGFKATDFPTQLNPLFATNNKVRNIEGYYISLIKNIGKDHMISFRYDEFDPNTKKSDSQVATIDDLKFHNWTAAYQYFFNENVKILLSYTMPINEKSSNSGITNLDWSNRDHKDDSLTVRLQARF